MKKKKPFLFATVIVAVTLLAMSGACSQHEPGTYQGGGRTEPTSVIGQVSGGPVESDSSAEDTGSLPDIKIPDVIIPDVLTGG